MKFEDFGQMITDHVEGYAVVQWGSIGINYLDILTIRDGEIISIGRVLYRAWRENWKSEFSNLKSVLMQLGREATAYSKGERDTLPSAHMEPHPTKRNHGGGPVYVLTVV